ncbi:MAG: hypothetical protein WBL82_01295, partial [Terriglobales bacterium]
MLIQFGDGLLEHGKSPRVSGRQLVGEALAREQQVFALADELLLGGGELRARAVARLGIALESIALAISLLL